MLELHGYVEAQNVKANRVTWLAVLMLSCEGTLGSAAATTSAVLVAAGA